MDILASVINASLMVYIFVIFFSAFSKKRFSNILHVAFLISIILIFSAVLIFVDDEIIRTAIFITITLIISCLYVFKWYNAILLSLLVYALGALSEIMTTALLSLLFSVDTQIAVEGPFFIMGLLISKFITFIFILFIRVKKKKILFSESLKKLPLLISIPCSTIIILLLQYYYFMSIPASSKSILPAMLCYTFLIFSNILVFNLIEHFYQDAEKETELIFAKKLISAQTDQYQQLLDYNKNILKLQHDHKNYLLGLISEIEQNRIDSALTSLKSQCDILKLPYHSASPRGIIGTIVTVKSAFAQSKGIAFDFSHSELSNIVISEIDLAIILGNALDNAIESLEKTKTLEDKNISLTIKMHNNQIIIIVKNNVEYEIDTENPQTTKGDKEKHGLGILSIKNLANKYGGEAIFSCTNKTFQVYIVLPNKAI